MRTLLFAFYVVFVLDAHPEMMRRSWQRHWVYDTAREVAKTDASPQEGLRLMEIPVHESGFDPKAVGRKGEKGRWQILGGNDFSANEALRRMRYQGMMGFVGCGGKKEEDKVLLPNGVHTTCGELVEHRVGPADAYLLEHRPPPTGATS
jgi:hypothetical protein